MMINGTHLINRAWIRNRDIAGRYVAVHEQRESLTCHIADRVFPCICAYSSIVACLAGAYSCCVQRCRQQQVIIIHCCLDPDVNVSPDAFAAEHGGIRSCNILPTEGILSLVPVPTVNPPPQKKKVCGNSASVSGNLLLFNTVAFVIVDLIGFMSKIVPQGTFT